MWFCIKRPVGVGNTDHIKFIIGSWWGARRGEEGGSVVQWKMLSVMRFQVKLCYCGWFITALQRAAVSRGSLADRVSDAAERLAGCIKLVRSNRSH